MKYASEEYWEKQKQQLCTKMIPSRQKNVFYCEILTPRGHKNVKITVDCDCDKGSNWGTKERLLCSHGVTALKKLLETNATYVKPPKKEEVKFRGDDWEEQRQKALERDGHECYTCKRRGKVYEDVKKLQVHHIEPFRVSKNNDLYNLIVLCPRHHKVEDNFFIQYNRPSNAMKIFQENLIKRKQVFTGIEMVEE